QGLQCSPPRLRAERGLRRGPARQLCRSFNGAALLRARKEAPHLCQVGTITFCAVPVNSMHRHADGRCGTESGPLKTSQMPTVGKWAVWARATSISGKKKPKRSPPASMLTMSGIDINSPRPVSLEITCWDVKLLVKAPDV